MNKLSNLKLALLKTKIDLFQRFRQMSLVLKLLNLFHK
jgi:hypothetical protein